MTLQFDHHLVHKQFSSTHFDAWLQNVCNAAVSDIPDINETGISFVIFLGVEQAYMVRFFFL